MDHGILEKSCQSEIIDLFTKVFTISEGEKEGGLIGGLVSCLSSRIDNREVICFGTWEQEKLIASIFFTRLRFDQPIKIYMLAPVAVSTENQGQGVGQALIRHGLNVMKGRSVSAVVTYGDPAFYSKIGFSRLPEAVIQAPLELSMPDGWLGQSLTSAAVPTVNQRPSCVAPFNDPVYW